MTSYVSNPLYKLMHPKSIAFWGASSNPLGMGTIQLRQLLDFQFGGAVYPIHPKESSILGLKAYQSVRDVPNGTADLAVLVLPTGIVPDILEECGKAGINRAVIVSAGFAEAGEEGKKAQQRLVEIARRYNITFIGPNCIGVINTGINLNTTFFAYGAAKGFIGMASQSGSFVTQMFVHLEKFGLGFSQGFSIGNEAMVDITDCLEYLGDCPDTKVIGLYIESIRRGRDFVRVAREVSKKKPIVAFYVGGSEAGGKAALSHTGALAGPDQLYSGIFRQCGIVRAPTIEALFDYCSVLGTQPLPRDNRVVVLTHSGGPGAAAADAAERFGLKLAEFSPETIKALQEVVPHTASTANPVDLTFSRSPNDYVELLPKVLLKDDNIDSMFMYILLPVQRVIETLVASGTDPSEAANLAQMYLLNQCKLISDLPGEFHKPVVGASFCPRSEPSVQTLQDSGFPVLPSPERASHAIAALTEYALMKKALLSDNESR